MAWNNFKRYHLMPLHFKGLRQTVVISVSHVDSNAPQADIIQCRNRQLTRH